MNIEESKKIVDTWLEKHKDESAVAVEIDENVRYLMAQQYLAGYIDGSSAVISVGI